MCPWLTKSIGVTASAMALVLASLGIPGQSATAATGAHVSTASHAAAAAGSDDPVGCTTNTGNPCTPPLKPHGGYVQHHPKVYLIFWGPDWKTNTEEQKVASALTTMFTNLPGTAWNNILTQYSDGTAVGDYPHNDQPVYAGSWIDTSSPNPVSFGVTQAVSLYSAEDEITNTALRANSSWQAAWNADNNDQQFMLLPEQGSSYDGLTIGSNTCGIHDNANSPLYVGNQMNLNFSVIRVGTDNPCEADSYSTEENADQATATTTATASHEYAETVTDPTGSGWTTDDQNSDWWNPTTWAAPPEVADMCEGLVTPGSWDPTIKAVVQELWDNSDYYASPQNQQNKMGCVSQRGQDYKQDSECMSLPVHTVYGNMYTDYASFGQDTGDLGCPTSEREPYQGGAEQTFQHGAIYQPSWSSDTGAAAVWGPIAADAANNYQVGVSSSVGWPAANEHALSGGGYEADFTSGAFLSDGGANTGWVGSAILAKWKSWGGGSGPLGFPTGNQQAVNGGLQVAFQHGVIFDDGGAISVSFNGRQVVGHAAHTGDDYPYETLGQFGHTSEGTDAWNEYYGQCDSFAAWKVYENLAGSAAQHPAVVPAPGWTPSNWGISPVNQFTFGPNGGLGNADAWALALSKRGYLVDDIPIPGAIAYWANGAADPQDGMPADASGLPGSSTGHVGYVTDVYPDGSITVEMYNMRENGEYSVVHMAYGQGYTDNSFGQGNYSVPWPTSFIHVGDGPSGTSSPPEPAVGVVSAGYPAQVKVIGPGSSASQFALHTSTWYLRAGHGELGTEEWTHTNGATADSTATWAPAGLAASTCYQVDAFVPDNYSDNPVAVYTVTDAMGTANAAVNENVQTSDWSELGVFKTNSSGGGLSVTLDDRGVTGLYVAADAMRFWQQSCGGYGNVSPIMAPTSTYGTWHPDPGHGFSGNMAYSPTTGTSTASANAAWAPTHLISYGCYDVSVYVPDNYSDNPGADYYSNDVYYGAFYPQVDENAYTNQFAWIGTFQAYSDGTLPVELFNDGPAQEFVAADTVAYVLNPHCLAENGATNAFGSTYTSAIIGPGSPSANFSTTNDWYYQIGHGYANHELWTHTNGSTAVSTATWTFYGTANACYTASAYIPNNYADNTNASYTFGTQAGFIGTQINQAASTGWTSFQGNPKIPAGSNGKISVTLNDTGPDTSTYTAADAIAFTQVGC